MKIWKKGFAYLKDIETNISERLTRGIL